MTPSVAAPGVTHPSVVLPAGLLVAWETGNKTELLQMLEVTAIGRHSGSQALGKVRHRLDVYVLSFTGCVNIYCAEICSALLKYQHKSQELLKFCTHPVERMQFS